MLECLGQTLSANSRRSQMVLDWTNDHIVLDAFGFNQQR
ncbi:conserved hypothetical protein [Methylovorus sp. MP688]|nr:conserved hypothetical protein [Methylovorus sp. MP688]